MVYNTCICNEAVHGLFFIMFVHEYKCIIALCDCDALPELQAATERSSAQNKAATGGWRWKDRKGFVDHHFRKLPEICKYNQFRYSYDGCDVSTQTELDALV